jgi:4-deoxy-L-threo-5-hexosulose-uronate ketol-isomerase
MPLNDLRLEPDHELGTRYFTERRELGIFSIGDPGSVVVDGKEYTLDRLDCLYVGTGCEEVIFRRVSGQPAFYLASCPAHAKHAVAKMSYAQADRVTIGTQEKASVRTINKYIWTGGIASAQLVMGLTELAPGSIWNTFPPHLHSRRMEAYCYFDIGADEVVVHLMGTAEETRHLMVRNREVVLSPAWSIHSGAGSSAYRFIWAMAGENMEFSDIDGVAMNALR